MNDISRRPFRSPLTVTNPDQSSLSSNLASGAKQVAARTAEQAIGLPGNVLSTVGTVGNALTSNAPKPLATYEQIQEELPVSFPTSSQVREWGKEKTGGEFEPKSKSAEFGNAIAETAAAMLVGSAASKAIGAAKSGGSFLEAGKQVAKGLPRQVASAATGETFAQLSKSFGGSDLTQGIARTTGLLLGTFGFRKGELKTLASEIYDSKEKELAGKMIPAEGLSKDLWKINNKYGSGDSPAKKFVADRMEAIGSALAGDEIDAGKLWQLKKDVGEQTWEQPYFSAARKAGQQIVKVLDKGLREIGTEGYDQLKTADNIWSSLNDSSDALKFVENAIPSSIPLLPWVKGLFKAGLGYGASAATTTSIPATAAIYGGYKAVKEGKMIYNFLKTPAGAKFYGDVFNAAFAGNANAVVNNVQKFNSAAKKFEKKQEPERRKID